MARLGAGRVKIYNVKPPFLDSAVGPPKFVLEKKSFGFGLYAPYCYGFIFFCKVSLEKHPSVYTCEHTCEHTCEQTCTLVSTLLSTLVRVQVCAKEWCKVGMLLPASRFISILVLPAFFYPRAPTNTDFHFKDFFANSIFSLVWLYNYMHV